MALIPINRSYPDILRKVGVQQTQNSLLWIAPGYRHDTVSSAGVSNRYAFASTGARLKAFELHNRTAGNANVGIGFRWANHYWQAGRYDGTTYTRLTDLQARTATAIQVTGADQTGFVILSDRPFDWFSGDVTTSETDDDAGGEISHTLRFSNYAGTDWVTLNAASPYIDNWTTAAAAEWTTGARNFVWARPADWGLSTGLTGIPNGYYALHMQSTGRQASDVAAVVTGLEIGAMYALDTLGTTGVWRQETADYDDPYADAMVAFFGTADAGNRVSATLETR